LLEAHRRIEEKKVTDNENQPKAVTEKENTTAMTEIAVALLFWARQRR
jgi:hypothetical protein